ncbi:RsfA family transcriptional regulator [Effusibacillus consociatus]|uniref:RsfA family transcriptional regulator n=1 Tax=Effusibacillus consociatus TaxID=1117041 RepID=A0ABV9Q558_9BACL
MKALRQDAWTEDDDRVLAEIILRHIQEGSTQLAAFEECAEKLGRTAAACGYRWNACVRKIYREGIEIAKAQRKQLKSMQRRTNGRSSESVKDRDESKITWNDVLGFLKAYKQEHASLLNHIRHLERDLNLKDKAVEDLSVSNERLERQYYRLSEEYQTVKEDYKTLVKIMERARKLTLFSSDMDEIQMTTRFRMDANGNLERLE